MKKDLTWIVMTVFLLLYTTVIMNGLASPTTTVAVDPPEVKDRQPGESFTINLTVSDVVISEEPPISNGLYAWSVNVTFDPAILNVTNTTEGPFLQQAAETVALPAVIDNTGGFVVTGAIIKPPYGPQGATGSGVLATITFTVVGQGATTLELTKLKLRTLLEGATETYFITTTAINGQFINSTAFPTETIVGVIGAVAIGGTLVAFFYRKRRTQTK